MLLTLMWSFIIIGFIAFYTMNIALVYLIFTSKASQYRSNHQLCLFASTIWPITLIMLCVKQVIKKIEMAE